MSDESPEETELWKAIQEAKDDEFVQPEQPFEVYEDVPWEVIPEEGEKLKLLTYDEHVESDVFDMPESNERNSPVLERSDATQGMDTTHWDMFEIACTGDDCDGRCYPLHPETDPDHNRVQCYECERVYEIQLETKEQ
ncbi:hypothetical protein OB955_04755 [Halobacteria archaeon AArc-m2/3/4]|uniref:Uncharacterized protein n=1 Tax=Natronoglomus mannanivorans TaxID=2979990 RepID=A0ABT2QAV1_9EURY|nr:hypothetical protein [Halobacteria archaeon AArc-m2/3/4]